MTPVATPAHIEETELDESLSPQQFNQQFIAAIEAADNGHCKNASMASSKMIRRRLRENGFLRLIIPPVNITDADLDRALETDLPRMIEDMEPDSPGATLLPFDDTPPSNGVPIWECPSEDGKMQLLCLCFT